jgi:DNA (cytosine-5)-methyltransferase 1
MFGRYFIDVFAGCGGLSLGLSEAGWHGLFAVEREAMAFKTFAANFLGKKSTVPFVWPAWLEQRPWPIEDLLCTHNKALRGLRGRVQLVAGGPPCQGFSFAGRRQKLDPRNMLFKKYVKIVDSVRPEVLLIENVLGMRVAHGATVVGKARRRGRPPEAYSQRLVKALSKLNYEATTILLDASEFGVPQRRPRLFVLGVRRSPGAADVGGIDRLVDMVEESRLRQLAELCLTPPVSCKEAIGDLETSRNRLRACTDPASPPGFQEPDYKGPTSHYQRLMRGCIAYSEIDSARLARHTDEVRQRFRGILKECRQGVALQASDRKRFGLSKMRIYPMSERQPAPTVTTLPDDILHYSEPRILSVRECARLQSFPDWFQFHGKYTTGGQKRAHECPRYTQVGNAVPPLLGRAIGHALAAFLEVVEDASTSSSRLAIG